MRGRDIRALVKKGIINSELEYERALSADRTLRLLSMENAELQDLRKELRDLIKSYENIHWSDESRITPERIKENDLAEELAETERKFIAQRKGIIKKRLEELDLKQKDLGVILGHSKSYTSELLNGIRAFSSSDLILIHRLFGIELKDLFLTTVPLQVQKRVRVSIKKISGAVKMKGKDLRLVHK